MKEPISSRNIPHPIKREVRQRCGFGCVICRLPLYEYEHMEEWATVKRHVAEEITLLCDQHHREKTSGLLPKEKVREANRNPFNLREGVSKPYNLHYSGDYAEVVIGSVTFESRDRGYGVALVPIIIDNIEVIKIFLEDGHFLLNVVLRDEFNHPILYIEDNQMIYKTDVFDIQLVGRTLTIREALRNIFIEIMFKTPNTILISKGRLLVNGVEIAITNNQVLINKQSYPMSFDDIVMETDVGAGIIIGSSQTPGLICIKNVNRYNFTAK